MKRKQYSFIDKITPYFAWDGAKSRYIQYFSIIHLFFCFVFCFVFSRFYFFSFLYKIIVGLQISTTFHIIQTNPVNIDLEGVLTLQ